MKRKPIKWNKIDEFSVYKNGENDSISSIKSHQNGFPNHYEKETFVPIHNEKETNKME
jgi:hypothetical protein